VLPFPYPYSTASYLLKFPKLKFLETSILPFFFLFFSKVQKVQKVIYKAIIVIFPEDLPKVNIYKFCKREIFVLPGEPREYHLGDVRPKKF